ncbi:MAG: HAD family phosphatase [Acidobacteriaceae bacterium]
MYPRPKVNPLKTLQKSTGGEGTPLRAILFDYGLVLSGPPNPAAWSRMRSVTSLDEEPFQRGYWAHRHAYDSGELSGVSYWQLIAAEAGLPVLSAEDLDALFHADTDLWTDLNLPMAEWAQSLQAAHIPTGILSNIGDQMEAGVLRKHPWLSAFHHITWSHRLQTAKPDPAIYRHAAAGLGVSPFNILFIDDKLENIEAARNCGMQTIQYSTHQHFLDDLKLHGFATLLEDPPRLPPHTSTSSS